MFLPALFIITENLTGGVSTQQNILQQKKKQTTDTCNNIDEPQKRYTWEKKPDTYYMIYVSTYFY